MMFDQVKMNKLSPANFLKIQDRETPDFIQKKTGSDFYTMIMEKTSDNDKMSGIKQNDEQTVASHENLKTYDHNPSERSSTSNADYNNGNDIKDTDYRKTSSGKDIAQKESSEKKKIESDPENTAGYINFLYNENNVKKIGEIIRSALAGDNKDVNEKLQNLFKELKNKFAQGSFIKSIPGKDDTEKIHKPVTGQLQAFSRELKQSLFADLQKLIAERKPVKNFNKLNDKDLKEIAVTILNNIKKTKSREVVKHDIKSGHDEIKTDKKQAPISEYTIKKSFFNDDTSSEKNSAGDRNTSRDNLNNTGWKSDLLSKVRSDKTISGAKTMDFRENLQDIIDKAKISVRDSRNGTFTVRLNPKELGSVNVNLIMENGVINGKFLVDNDDVKSQLMNNLTYLKNQLEESGISIGEFSVNVNDHRGKYLKQNDEDVQVSAAFLNSGRDLPKVVDQYALGAETHTGNINIVI